LSQSKSISPLATAFQCPNKGLLAMQSCGTLDELFKHAPEVKPKFERFLKDLTKEIEDTAENSEEFPSYKLGPLKKRERAEDKIHTDYGGKATLISDIIRGKVVVDSVEAIIKLREMLNPKDGAVHPLLKKHGIYCAQVTDLFADPKYETGYRCLNSKLAFPLDNGGEYLVELQIVHDKIEATYDKTHKHMRMAQDISREYADKIMPLAAAIRRSRHYDVCLFHNGKASKEGNLDYLLDNRKRALSAREAQSPQDMIRFRKFDYNS